MTAHLKDVFADTSFWIALVVKQDQYHDQAQKYSQQISGQITTTIPVLLETANALARPGWRPHAIALIDHLLKRTDMNVIALTPDLWERGWNLYRGRPDKGWSLTDCISFLVMQDKGLSDAMTADEHFRQAGYRPLLLEKS